MLQIQSNPWIIWWVLKNLARWLDGRRPRALGCCYCYYYFSYYYIFLYYSYNYCPCYHLLLLLLLQQVLQPLPLLSSCHPVIAQTFPPTASSGPQGPPPTKCFLNFPFQTTICNLIEFRLTKSHFKKTEEKIVLSGFWQLIHLVFINILHDTSEGYSDQSVVSSRWCPCRFSSIKVYWPLIGRGMLIVASRQLRFQLKVSKLYT